MHRLEIKSVIYSENSSINLEEHQPYNRLFRPREFAYLRHVVRDSLGQLFLIDRSISQPMLPPRPHCVRGELFNVLRMSQNEQQVMLVIDMTLQHTAMTPQQEHNHLQKYLHHLADGLAQHFGLPPPASSLLDIYNLDLSFEPKEPALSEHSRGQGVFSFTNPSYSFERSIDSLLSKDIAN
jgi:hypothetical protein